VGKFRVKGDSKVHILNEGHTVAYLVEALAYKPEGRGFDYDWCHGQCLEVAASKRNEYKEYFLG
jgi:3-dehydroquinate synthetase